MQKLLSEILSQITPTADEIAAEKKIVLELKTKIRRQTGKHAGLALVGSLSRSTHLAGDRDIDLFVFYPKHLTRKQFEAAGVSLGKKILKGHFWEQAYSEHPYIRGTYNGFDVEIVPAYRVKHASQKMSSVDRSPLHDQYLKKRQKPKHKPQVRLLKQFLKGIQAYGADLHYNALPGFGVELLIQQYNTFPNALSKISKWKKPVYIDAGRKADKKKALKQFVNYPLILIDPTDKNRNVAAALSEHQFLRMRKAAAAFLKKPSKKFFFPRPLKPLNEKQLRSKLCRRFIAGFWMPYPRFALSDIVWGQLRKLQHQFKTRLEQSGFDVKKTIADSDEKNEIVVLAELKQNRLSPQKIRVGPFKTDSENVKRFFLAHRGAKPAPGQKGRVALWVKRDVTTPNEALKQFEKELERSLKDPLAKTTGNRLPVTNSNALKKARFNAFFRAVLSRFLQKNKNPL